MRDDPLDMTGCDTAAVESAPVEAAIGPCETSFPSRIETLRRAANEHLDSRRRAELGQFMTPWPLAAFMASMFEPREDEIRLLDAGAGIGSLTAAFVDAACRWSQRPRSIVATCFEVDPVMLAHLRLVMSACETACATAGIRFEARIIDRDFIEAGSDMAVPSLYGARAGSRFNATIQNPPYRKLHSGSQERRLLRGAGIETSNLYAAFVGLALKLLEPGGQLVAITPRSFCNGPYFRPFRQLLLGEGTLQRVHVFESRNRAFSEDEVLQENVIVRVARGVPRREVELSTSAAPDAAVARRIVPHDLVVHPRDPGCFIHVAASDSDAAVATRVRALPCTLNDLDLQVSTGRVVDFRARAHLRKEPEGDCVPLIHPAHFENGFVAWPKLGGRKHNAIAAVDATRTLLVPSAVYVLTKRFTSKEERRRVVATIFDPERLPAGIDRVGFENHVNYFHARGAGLAMDLAKGLAAYLDSTLVDRFFRQFNGHTQVNASDLRSLRYPDRAALMGIGARVGAVMPDQAGVDELVNAVLDA